MPVDDKTPTSSPFQNGAIGAPMEKQPAHVGAVHDEQTGEDPVVVSKPTLGTFLVMAMVRPSGS